MPRTMLVLMYVAGLLPCAAATSVSAAEDTPAAASVPDFNRDIRPILSNHCFACHGPDPGQRQADLRLDTAEGLSAAVVAGDVEASELIARIDSDDPDMQMPPTDHAKPLSAGQRLRLRQWVSAGAPYESHWSLVAPERVRPPAVKREDLVATPVDAFILRRLEAEGLSPNDRADRAALIRRVTLDLTGLPPTAQQVRAFIEDESPDAYEALVDRLLDSPRYGEHMGRYWLDLVRYGDTHGLHLDNYREMWPYRDWVINAFNRNQPFDRFMVEQLAGDLLPNPTLDQQIASGFNRLNVTTSEGGSIYDEVFFRNCVERVDAFGTVFLGLTTGCAVCHDHKFDPITQKDYYSLYAFFNSLDGQALDGNVKDHPPVVRVPDASHQQQLETIDQTLAALESEMNGPLPAVDQAQRRWEQSLAGDAVTEWQVLRPSSSSVEQDSPLKLEQQPDGTVVASGAPAAKDTLTIEAPLPPGDAWQVLRLEALTADPEGRVGLSENGNAVLSEVDAETRSAATGDQWLPVRWHYAEADFQQTGDQFDIRHTIDGKVADNDGWGVGGHEKTGPRSAWFMASGMLGEGSDAMLRVRLHFQSQWSGHQFARVRLSVGNGRPQPAAGRRIESSDWHQVGPFPVESPRPGYSRKFASQQEAFDAEATFRYQDRDYRWQHRPELVDAQAHALPTLDQSSVVLLHRSIAAPEAQTVTLLLGTDDGVQVWLNGKKVAEQQGQRELSPLQDEYPLELKKGNNDLYVKTVNHQGPMAFAAALRSPAVAVPESLRELAAIAVDQRTTAQQAALQNYYRRVVCVQPDWLAIVDHRNGLRKQRESIEQSIPVTLVWKETDEPRQAHVMERGQYDQPGDPVKRAVPSFLPPLPQGAPLDRRGLALWLIDPSHPLTARVAVNRFWQQLFGTGLVKTSEDFGAQGEQPSHPELLDYLAVDFRQSGWDVKRMMKQLVMSEAYRRSAQATPEMLAHDPENRLLARGPRFRLDAEMLRDQALAVSGLLSEQLGGPSVKPPQPAGLWEAVGYTRSNTANFTPDTGDKIYRRSVYIFWKRTSPPPQMTTFDAPSRESCTARRERTNTPLQALLLMNEPQYVEAAKRLAVIGIENPSDDAGRIDDLFLRCASRPPTASERDELLQLLKDATAMYRAKPELTQQLVGEATADGAQRAAWTILASTLLNLDEVVTK